MTVPVVVQRARQRAQKLREARDFFRGCGDQARAESLHKRYVAACGLIEGRLLGLPNE